MLSAPSAGHTDLAGAKDSVSKLRHSCKIARSSGGSEDKDCKQETKGVADDRRGGCTGCGRGGKAPCHSRSRAEQA